MSDPPTSPRFDLQSHSTHSDGELAPAEVVAAAAQAGVERLALTDHDSVAGVAEARHAAREHGIQLIEAVEISVLDGTAQDLHLLGYGIDIEHPGLAELLSSSRSDRETRAERMVTRLEALGWQVDLGGLEARSAAGLTIGRPHLAEMVISHPGNRARLLTEGIADATAFLVAYLIEGTPGFVPRAAPSVEAAIATVHAAGGLTVWAHPFWDIEVSAAVLSTLGRFRELGLDGVEAFYITHTREQTTALHARARELGLLTTGSADFHGPGHVMFNRFRNFSLYDLSPDLGALAS